MRMRIATEGIYGVVAVVLALNGTLAVGASPQGTARMPTRYTIDPDASEVVLHVGKGGLFSFAGHTHQVAAPVAEGAIEFDRGNPSGLSVLVEFDAARLRVTGEGEPPEDVPEVQATMESERVLDVTRFPRIRFASRQVEVTGEEGNTLRLSVQGDLTLHGVARPLTADVSMEVAPDRLAATGTLVIRQSDFGIAPITAGAGTVRVKDEVEAVFTLVAAPAL